MDRNIIKKLFNRQVIISIDMARLFPEFISVMEGNIIYEDHESREYLTAFSRNDPDSVNVIMKLQKYNIKTEEVGHLVWVKIPEAHYYEKGLLDSLKGTRRLDEIEGVVMYAPSPVVNGRIYHLIHLDDKNLETVTDRLLDLFISYNDHIGPGSFRIEEISSDLITVNEFIRKYTSKPRLVEMALKLKNIPAVFEGIIYYPTLDIKNLGFLLSMNGEIYSMKMGTLDEIMGGQGFSAFSVFSEGRDSMSIVAHMEASCDGSECVAKMIMEEKVVPASFNAISRLLKKGMEMSFLSYESV